MPATFTFKTGTVTDLKTKEEKQIGRFMISITHYHEAGTQPEMRGNLIDNEDTIPENFTLESVFIQGETTWEIKFFNCMRDILDRTKFNCEKRIGKKVFVVDEI